MLKFKLLIILFLSSPLIAGVTYDPSAGVSMGELTITGYTAAIPCDMDDLYTADIGGTMTLTRRVVSSTDVVRVANDADLRPTDEYVMGGTKGDLYVYISSWQAGMTSVSIDLIGTDEGSLSSTKTITMTGLGISSATTLFHTLTHTQVSTFTQTGGANFQYDLIQGKWGVVWELGESSYMLEARVAVGNGVDATFFRERNASIDLNIETANAPVANRWMINLLDNAEFQLGMVDTAGADKGKTYDGCRLVFKPTHGDCYILKIDGGTVELYFSLLSNRGSAAYGIPLFVNDDDAAMRVRRTTFDSCRYILSYGTDAEWYDIKIYNTSFGFSLRSSPALMDKLYCDQLEINANAPANTWFYAKNSVVWTHLKPYGTAIAPNKNIYLIDSVWSDTLVNRGVGDQAVKEAYTYKLIIKDVNNVPISGARIRIKETDGTNVLNQLTNADGYMGADNGTASAGAANTLTDATKAWTIDGWKAYDIMITGGTGSGQTRTVVSNTATIVTIESVGWATNPDATSRYVFIPRVLTRHFTYVHPDWVTDDKRPHTMKIIKDGYLTYEAQFNMSEAYIDTIKLFKSPYNNFVGIE